MATEEENVDILPKQPLLILAACHRQTGGCKPVIGLSPGYRACPLIPYILHLRCVPVGPHRGGFCRVLLIVTKGCEWLWGAALRCPALTSHTTPLFYSLTSGLTWTDRLPVCPSIHFLNHILPHPATVIPLYSLLNPGATQIPSLNEPQEVQDQLLSVSWQSGLSVSLPSFISKLHFMLYLRDIFPCISVFLRTYAKFICIYTHCVLYTVYCTTWKLKCQQLCTLTQQPFENLQSWKKDGFIIEWVIYLSLPSCV